MYLPTAFRLDDEAAIEAFIGQYDFATIVSTLSNGPRVTHAPLLTRRNPEGRLVLVGHVARDNDHWRAMDGATPAVAIFHGPQGYISPTWYASAPAVPTWNYAVVHAHGKPFAPDDDAFTETAISALVDKYENGPGAWRIESMPPDFYAGLLSSIVGFEMPIERLEAKFKLGQNRTDADRAGAVAGLERQGSPQASALADLMRDTLKGAEV
jgi:transcriptional regulator